MLKYCVIVVILLATGYEGIEKKKQLQQALQKEKEVTFLLIQISPY